MSSLKRFILSAVALTMICLGDGAVLDTINVGQNPQSLVFDGHNVWVSNFDNTITKIRIY